MRRHRGPYKEISNDTRIRFIKAILSKKESEKLGDIATMFDINPKTGSSIMSKFYRTGRMERDTRQGGRPYKVTPEICEFVSAMVDQNPALTLKQIKSQIMENFHVFISEMTVSTILTKQGFTVKLIRQIPESRNTEETLDQRMVYCWDFVNHKPMDDHIIYIDETGFNLHVRRHFGRARKGKHACLVVPNNKGSNISVCAAMSCEGLILKDVSFEPYNSVKFEEFMKRLCDYLHFRGLYGCWLVCDNVRFHHSKRVADVVEMNGHTLKFLPPYSPMLNPIEHMFSKWKNEVKLAGVQNTREELLRSIDAGAEAISMMDCIGFVRETQRNVNLGCFRTIFE